MNAHDAIIDAVLTALSAAPAVTSGPIVEDIDAAELPEEVAERVSVTLESSAGAEGEISGAPVYWESAIAVACSVRADERGVAGRASRGLHAACYARLMSDPSLGGVALRTEPPVIRQDQALAASRIGVTTGVYLVHHRTAHATLDV